MPIEAQGDLRLESPVGRVLNLAAAGIHIGLDSPRLADLRALLPGSSPGIRKTLVQTESALLALGLVLHVSVSGRTLLRIGVGTRSNLAGRFLGLVSGRVSLGSALGAWLRDL